MNNIKRMTSRQLADLKREIISNFDSKFHYQVKDIKEDKQLNKKSKTVKYNKVMNSLVDELKSEFINKYNLQGEDNALMALIVQYCFTCLTLEYRHSVWNYTAGDIAFSRRIGELWEKFCSVAWDYSAIAERFTPPKFNAVKTSIVSQAIEMTKDHPNKFKILDLIEGLFEIIGDINLKEDEMFFSNGIRYIVDFKSGFGSNEKGNMLRLQAVAIAYNRFDKNTRLLLLVRQNENNNYLNVLRNSKRWEVYTGADTYNKINELTGIDIKWVIDNVVDFKSDLSTTFYSDLFSNQLVSYLDW